MLGLGCELEPTGLGLGLGLEPTGLGLSGLDYITASYSHMPLQTGNII